MGEKNPQINAAVLAMIRLIETWFYIDEAVLKFTSCAHTHTHPSPLGFSSLAEYRFLKYVHRISSVSVMYPLSFQIC